MLLFVLVPERSTARKTWPTNPSGLIGSAKTMSPPRFTLVLRSNVGTTLPFLAFVERTHQIPLVVKFTPPIKRLPRESTSNVPHAGEFGMLIGFIQVNPPSVDRVNCLPPKLFPSVLQY